MKNHERTVSVDMDGVMADFEAAALVSVPVDQRKSRLYFHVADNYNGAVRPGIEAAYNAPVFFSNRLNLCLAY